MLVCVHSRLLSGQRSSGHLSRASLRLCGAATFGVEQLRVLLPRTCARSRDEDLAVGWTCKNASKFYNVLISTRSETW